MIIHSWNQLVNWSMCNALMKKDRLSWVNTLYMQRLSAEGFLKPEVNQHLDLRGTLKWKCL